MPRSARIIIAGLVGSILLVLVSSADLVAASLTEAPALFPDAKPPLQSDGTPRTIVYAENDKVEVTPLRFTPLPGRSEAASTTWCGVMLRSTDKQPQGLVTIGTAFTEALSCGGLLEVGAVPPSDMAKRIGLIYRTASPNASVVTPIVLVRNPGTLTWSIDAALSLRLTQRQERPTLAGMRHALGGH